MEQSRAYFHSSLSARGTGDARLHSRASLPAQSQPSSSGATFSFVELCLPLDAVPAARSTGSSYRRRSSSAAPSHTHSHSRSPVSEGRPSRSRSRSRTRRSPNAGSSQGKSHKESSRRPRPSHSPSRTSSRGRFASREGEKFYSYSRLPSQSQRADEGRQEEQSLLDLASVVTTLRSLNELPEAPLESRKIRDFRAAMEDDDQPALLYKMPVGGASAESWRISMTGFCHLLRECTPRRSRSCCSIQVSTAGSSTGSRGRPRQKLRQDYEAMRT